MIGTSGHKTVTHQTGARLIDLKQANTAQHTNIQNMIIFSNKWYQIDFEEGTIFILTLVN